MSLNLSSARFIVVFWGNIAVFSYQKIQSWWMLETKWWMLETDIVSVTWSAEHLFTTPPKFPKRKGVIFQPSWLSGADYMFIFRGCSGKIFIFWKCQLDRKYRTTSVFVASSGNLCGSNSRIQLQDAWHNNHWRKSHRIHFQLVYFLRF